MIALSTNKLNAGYGNIIVLRDISLRIEKGSVVSIIGRNGVGKSTLMKALIGVLPVKSGEIHFHGQDITGVKSNERAQLGIGYVPQGHGVFPLLTVEENLIMGRQINKKEVDKPLDIAYSYFPRLYERKKQKAGTLSGGEQAMLSIGRALVGKPEVMLLDEPSEGIQPNLAQQIGEIILKCSQDLGLTVVLCEQHIGLIQLVSQSCYAVDKGMVVCQMPREELQDYGVIKKYLSV